MPSLDPHSIPVFWLGFVSSRCSQLPARLGADDRRDADSGARSSPSSPSRSRSRHRSHRCSAQSRRSQQRPFVQVVTAKGAGRSWILCGTPPRTRCCRRSRSARSSWASSSPDPSSPRPCSDATASASRPDSVAGQDLPVIQAVVLGSRRSPSSRSTSWSTSSSPSSTRACARRARGRRAAPPIETAVEPTGAA